MYSARDSYSSEFWTTWPSLGATRAGHNTAGREREREKEGREREGEGEGEGERREREGGRGRGRERKKGEREREGEGEEEGKMRQEGGKENCLCIKHKNEHVHSQCAQHLLKYVYDKK